MTAASEMAGYTWTLHRYMNRASVLDIREMIGFHKSYDLEVVMVDISMGSRPGR